MANDVDYVMSVRAVRNGGFVSDVGPTRFLAVPVNSYPAPDQAITASAWCKAVITAGEWKNAKGEARGDILFIVHGYNMSEQEIMDRHRRIKDDLATLKFKGVIVSFDWPCSNSALAYLADRHLAKETALRLVDDGIRQLSARQTPDCAVNIHLLAHSTGAYVIREAFDDADDTELAQSSWLVSQIMFAAGDVSASSMSAGNAGAASVYNHCLRLTNYSNQNDVALDISNVKRLGVAPRVGRIGLPGDSPPKAINVDCTEYYALLDSDSTVEHADEPLGRPGTASHSWYFGNAIFTRDVFETIIGIENAQRSTRVRGSDGRLHLARSNA
jgi:esterase/lipase superfamily enzyme